MDRSGALGSRVGSRSARGAEPLTIALPPEAPRPTPRAPPVAWYAETEWPRLRQVAADPEARDATYPDWLKGAEKTLRDLANPGIVAERVDATVAEVQQ